MDGEISIEHYSYLRKDRNRNGGGVSYFIHKSIAFEERSDFSDDFENIFIDILLPKTKPILSVKKPFGITLITCNQHRFTLI